MGMILAGPWPGSKAGSDPKAVPTRDSRHEFESYGEIMRRLGRERRMLEAGIGKDFDARGSLQLDAVIVQQENIAERLSAIEDWFSEGSGI